MQTLKIKIKEVVEEKRQLKFEEICVWGIYTHKYVFTDSILYDCEKKLKELGFVEIIEDNYPTIIGLFRKETIRDATREEKNAWWYKYTNPDADYTRDQELLEDKEIILEVIEE